jgi:hypothetical protein
MQFQMILSQDGSTPLALAWERLERQSSQFRPMDSNSPFIFHRYVRWISSGSGEICPFSHSKTGLSTTFPVFNPKKWFYTFSKDMALEKMTTCADICLIILVIFVFSGSLPAVLLHFKTRCDSVHSVDSFRPEIQTFLDSVFLTDACMIYAPSQIALAAVIHAASRQKQRAGLVSRERRPSCTSSSSSTPNIKTLKAGAMQEPG